MKKNDLQRTTSLKHINGGRKNRPPFLKKEGLNEE